MPALVSRFVDWFWLSAAERAVRTDVAGVSPRVLALAERASTASEVAERTSHPPEPFAHPGSMAIAAELYRESIQWALLAHAAHRGERHPDTVTNEPGGLIGELDRTLLRTAVGSDIELERLLSDLSRTYLELADLDERAQRGAVDRLERASDSLLEPFGTAPERLRHIGRRRAVHLVGSFAFFAGMLLVVQNFVQAERRASDLAAHATWTTSSRSPEGGCESPRQLCSGGEHFFFHTTQENDPSITFDLGEVHRISGIEIDNRIDCCTERAKPLAVAVSLDRRHWREVARHTKDFTSWRESFDAVRARYVKVHVPGPEAVLHLSKVRIYP